MAVSYNEMMTGGSQKKKKKQPFDPYAGGGSTPAQQPQTYGGNKAVNQAPGVGGNTADPLVAAITGGATGGGLGVNNQAANMPPGVGGNVGGVDTSTTTATPSQGANTPPGMPPPPPPPIVSPYASGTSTPGAPVTPATNETNPLSNVSTVQAMTEERSKPPATETNPLSNTEFVQDLTTKATEPVTTETNPLSNTEFVQDLTTKATEPVRTETNPLSNTEFVQDLAEERSNQPLTENPLSNTGFVEDLTKERLNKPLTENPLGDPDFVEDLTTKATALTENPLNDADFVKKLTADATEPSPYDSGAGADMAAMQNVVEPAAAPMADTLEDALRQQYMNRVGGTDDPIMASQLADQQFRQNEARKALVEQLGRYGVLRGGGDTAAALARMGEGDERNRLALEAQAAQRRQQDLRDAQGFDLGQRGMGLQEGRFDQDRLTQELAREVTEAGQTGEFRGGQTMAGQRQEADIFGEVDGRQTLTGETTRSGLDTQDMQRRIAEAGQTGLFDTGVEGTDPIQTQQAKALGSELDTAALGRDATRAGMTGQFEGEDTLEKTLREAAMTGRIGDETTLAGRQAEQDLIGSILAGTDIDDPRLDPLLQSLTDRLGEGGLFTEENRQAFEDRLGLGEIPELPEYPLSAENKDEFENLQTKLTNFDKLPEKDKRKMADMRQEMVEKMRELSDPNNSPYIQDLVRKEEQGGPLLPQEKRRLMEVRNRLGTGE